MVGGGCTGASIAYHLACRGVDVLLLERGGLASGPTGRSSAILRQHYSLPLLVEMAVHGLRTYSSFEETVGSSSGFVRTGFVIGVAEHDREKLAANVAMQRQHGVTTELLDPDDLERLDPRIATDGLALLCYEPEAGYCDPYLATAGFAAAAGRLGGRVVEGVAVRAVSAGRVETDSGPVAAETVVVAGGSWSVELVAPLGYALPVHAGRAQLGRFRLPAGFEPAPPTLADFEQLFYLKPAEPGYLEVGSLDPRSAEEVVDPDRGPKSAAPAMLDRLAASLARRLPALARGHWRGSWSSVYDVTPDWHPAIGCLPGEEKILLAAGFSGDGFKLAPAVGLSVAELACDGDFQTFDLGPLDPGRFARGELLEARYGYSVIA